MTPRLQDYAPDAELARHHRRGVVVVEVRPVPATPSPREEAKRGPGHRESAQPSAIALHRHARQPRWPPHVPQAGGPIINDVSGFTRPEMVRAAAASPTGIAWSCTPCWEQGGERAGVTREVSCVLDEQRTACAPQRSIPTTKHPPLAMLPEERWRSHHARRDGFLGDLQGSHLMLASASDICSPSTPAPVLTRPRTRWTVVGHPACHRQVVRMGYPRSLP